MPAPLTPIPQHLPEVFSAKDAARSKLHSRRLKQSDITRISFAVYQRADPETIAVSTRAAAEAISFTQQAERWREQQRALATALSPHLPRHHFFCIRSAAALWELPNFGNLDPALDIACFKPTRPLRRKGFNASNVSPGLATTVTLPRTSIRLTDPPTVWAMHAAHLPLEDLVALGDAVIRQKRIPGTDRLERLPLAYLSDLERVVRSGRRVGIDRLRRALPLLRVSSASVPESHLRLQLQQWELPPFQLDYDIYDTHGNLLGCSEFAFPEFKLVVEYEGTITGQRRNSGIVTSRSMGTTLGQVGR
ncbi:hypothetical protein G7067_00500 [Leucobacter insecticola]|uniref:Uncharacterized protein n=1 Tax=Leucobacter insecticola TaxID=2714934 RepID=A0A6G8FFY4_9MICO|nr:hypothetical protein [Leucobacter insecticola]QIM15235.1 hypothetical protein G7067_00500 [Leucobacter insecticola]